MAEPSAEPVGRVRGVATTPSVQVRLACLGLVASRNSLGVTATGAPVCKKSHPRHTFTHDQVIIHRAVPETETLVYRGLWDLVFNFITAVIGDLPPRSRPDAIIFNMWNQDDLGSESA